MDKPVPREEIAAYVAEVSQPGIPYVSGSHNTLLKLTNKYGQSRVTMWLNEYWAELRAWRNHTRNR